MTIKPIFISTILLSCFFLFAANAKDDLDLIKADYYFTHLAFHKALPYYQKLAVKDGGGSYVLARLGDCYRLTGNIILAEKCYNKVVHMNRVADVIKLKYGKVLMQLQQYDSAAKWLVQYREANPADRRVANLIESCKTAAAILSTAHRGKAQMLDFNTDRAEFAPSLWNGHLVFASDTSIVPGKRTSSWTGSACYSIFAVSFNSAGNFGTDFNSLGTKGKVNIEWHDGPATFNAAGDTMYFTRSRYNSKFYSRGAVPNRDSVVVLEIMMATNYDEATMMFTKVLPFTFNNKSCSVAHPTVSSNGSFVIFTSTISGSGSDLYISRRNRMGKWLKPISLGKNINTEGEEVFPFLINDTTLCFASDGHKGLGGLDVYIAHWDNVSQCFLPPINVGVPVNSSYDDISMALTADRTGYFSSNRPAEKGGDNIYYYKGD